MLRQARQDVAAVESVRPEVERRLRGLAAPAKSHRRQWGLAAVAVVLVAVSAGVWLRPDRWVTGSHILTSDVPYKAKSPVQDKMPRYVVKAEARQSGDVITTVVTVSRPHAGSTTEEIVARPTVVVAEGQRGQVTTDAVDGHPGLTIEVTSVKGSGSVVVASTAADRGTVIWTDRQTVKIEKGR